MSSINNNSITLIKYHEATIMIKNVPLKLIMRINDTKKIFMRLCTNDNLYCYENLFSLRENDRELEFNFFFDLIKEEKYLV